MAELFDNKHCIYVFLIAVLHGCSLEKAKALYEGEKVWVSPEMVDEMAEMYKTMNMQEILVPFLSQPESCSETAVECAKD